MDSNTKSQCNYLCKMIKKELINNYMIQKLTKIKQ